MVKEELEYNLKRTFRKTSEKFTGSRGNSYLCNRCECKPHGSKSCPALNKKSNTCEKVGHFAKICKNKTQPTSGYSDQHHNFSEEEGQLCGQTK